MLNKLMLSKERRQYLQKKKQKKVAVFLTQILILAAFLGIWEILADTKMIDSFITSQPSRIWQTLMNLGSNDLLTHIGVTVYETLVGFLLGTFMGIIIAIILWWSNFLAKVSEPFLVVLNSLPKVALRASYHHLGRSRNASHYRYGYCHLVSSYYLRKLKWIPKNRSRSH
jgi:NitT/TauT family transport system permease protein